MRILVLSPRQCWPPTNGARLREYHLARFLGRHAELSLAFLSSPGSPVPTVEDLPFCRDLVSVPRPRPYTLSKILRGFVGRWPVTMLNFSSAEMETALMRLLWDREFDLVQLEAIHMAPYSALLACGLRTPRVVYDWHNIESELMCRYAETVDSLPRAVAARWTAGRIRAVEAWVLRTGSGHLVCSERERCRLLEIAPTAQIVTVDNGVDTEFFRQTAQGGAERNRILFVGLMSYHANIEAAVWFTRRLWPAIRERHPRWRLTIAGADPAPSVLALASVPAVEITGTVPDLRPYYREAVAAVVPLRTGGGTRLKIIEAMAAGVPVVSTTLGAEGLEVQAGRHFLAADRDEEWLLAMDLLASQHARWIQLAQAGLELVRSRYDWEVLGARLCETYSRWMGRS